jgi:hypothetical protein
MTYLDAFTSGFDEPALLYRVSINDVHAVSTSTFAEASRWLAWYVDRIPAAADRWSVYYG